MDPIIFEKANTLNNKLKEFNEVLNCFGWKPDVKKNRADIRLSLNPQLIIEYDGADGRELSKIPIRLNSVFVDLIKAEIEKEVEQLVKEFNAL
ncbi:MAG: hypothetical protein WCI31_06235 [Prolixibacteraceae bacterium]